MKNEELKIEIPDEAVSYIVSRYLIRRSKDDIPITIGINTNDVEAVLQLFIDWAAENGSIEKNELKLKLVRS